MSRLYTNDEKVTLHTEISRGCRVLSMIGGEDVEMTVDRGRSYRPQFSRGVWGHATPGTF